MPLNFLITLASSVVSFYICLRSSEEMSLLFAAIAAVTFATSLVLAPWQLQLMLLILILLLPQQVFKQVKR